MNEGICEREREREKKKGAKQSGLPSQPYEKKEERQIKARGEKYAEKPL